MPKLNVLDMSVYGSDYKVKLSLDMSDLPMEVLDAREKRVQYQSGLNRCSAGFNYSNITELAIAHSGYTNAEFDICIPAGDINEVLTLVTKEIEDFTVLCNELLNTANNQHKDKIRKERRSAELFTETYDKWVK